ncbi:molybdopterin-guanine dinucleotide biosynthesis protein A [Halopelagius inordinatus]|uniref:Probable molybdenum cofactor guanylyltransferase n=1 Tax=Halopelagius inordinatus TaxID=553467 RepID=A0A1I2TI92_9EURY|nr:molybdenum cofactor guanylyltransferase [Halopelagius inordinatus]SFG62061.1 molybdopterin-guanine dinucleotide biosynthesis protein A [Halopelagius inordinatus]
MAREETAGAPDARRLDAGTAGIVLAGGRSTRFDGGDKALASLDGVPLVARVADTLEPLVDHLVVNCREDQRDSLAAALSDVAVPVTFAPDPMSDRGPLFGLRTALRNTDCRYAVAVPCDMPALTTTFLAHLRARARGSVGAVVRWNGMVDPLPLAVHVRAGEVVCTETLRDGRHDLRSLVSALSPAVVSESTAAAHGAPGILRDVDTRADLGSVARE